METLTCLSEERRARTFRSPENAPDSTDTVPLSPSTLFDLLTNSAASGLYGRTYQVYSVPMGGAISQPFYPSLPEPKLESPNKALVQPDLFATLDGIDSAWHGECWMLNLPEHPAFRSPFRNADGVSSLSDILETGRVPQKYFLSREACLGILRRASKRGKSLPAVLETALRRQSECAQDAMGGAKER